MFTIGNNLNLWVKYYEIKRQIDHDVLFGKSFLPLSFKDRSLDNAYKIMSEMNHTVENAI